MDQMKDKTAIVGVGYAPQGVVLGRSTQSLLLEACVNAMEHAGLTNKEVDGLIIQQAGGGDLNSSSYGLAAQWGLSTRFAADQSTMGVTAGCAAAHAARAVANGKANYVVVA